ncbi:putative protease YrrO [Paenibacillus larvae subsp. larvae DSM 25430]|nr:putative protease YrrO [Paenibacillus larvae subsp. larvae DSM 25430]
MNINMRKIRREDIELLAPAGNWDCLRAAVANGANAVFFGVEKFNARARADNFQIDELAEIMSYLHKYGVKGFLTFNILVFEEELKDAKELIEACVEAGVDAVIVQDLGLVKMIREISPDFPIHGSTQMTITSPEAVEFTKPFDIERVVLGRENNLKQIAAIGKQAKLPMEVFVHGALCVSYSGQCLTSEMWGGRSANRGECAQACRLPYDLMVDGEQKPMGDIAYLLSPKDLAALELVPELIEAGVTSFKIEGRMKSPEYVANVVGKYRKAIDRYFEGDRRAPEKEEIRELEQSFSRGFTHGFLKGTNNKQLVEGTYPKSRGVFLGCVKQVLRDGVLCELEAPLKRGDGIVFDAGDPTQKEEGGRVYDLRRRGRKLEGARVPAPLHRCLRRCLCRAQRSGPSAREAGEADGFVPQHRAGPRRVGERSRLHLCRLRVYQAVSGCSGSCPGSREADCTCHSADSYARRDRLFPQYPQIEARRCPCTQYGHVILLYEVLCGAPG